MRKSNDMLWGANDGDWRCSLGYFKLDPNTGIGNYAIAGSVQGFVVGVNGYRMLASVPTLLGQQPDTAFENQALRMDGGDLLVFASEGLLSGLLNGGLTQAILLETLQKMHDDPVDVIVDHLARQLPLRPTEGCEQVDRSILILRRRF
jgi:serine phosphatase RsbU (regulator of sigma subunit)